MREAAIRLVACLTMCLMLILANATQTDAQAPSDRPRRRNGARPRAVRPARARVSPSRMLARDLDLWPEAGWPPSLPLAYPLSSHGLHAPFGRWSIGRWSSLLRGAMHLNFVGGMRA